MLHIDALQDFFAFVAVESRIENNDIGYAACATNDGGDVSLCWRQQWRWRTVAVGFYHAKALEMNFSLALYRRRLPRLCRLMSTTVAVEKAVLTTRNRRHRRRHSTRAH